MDLGKIIKSQQIVKGFRVVQKTKMWATLMCTVWCCCIEQSPYSCCILGTEPALLAVKPSHSQHTSCCLYRWTAAVSVPRMLYILRNMPKYTQDKKWSIASSMVGGGKKAQRCIILLSDKNIDIGQFCSSLIIIPLKVVYIQSFFASSRFQYIYQSVATKVMVKVRKPWWNREQQKRCTGYKKTAATVHKKRLI